MARSGVLRNCDGPNDNSCVEDNEIMTTLRDRLEKTISFDAQPVAKYVLNATEIIENKWDFVDGAEYEHARLKPILDALIECVEPFEILINAALANIKPPPSQIYQAFNAMADLEKRLEEME